MVFGIDKFGTLRSLGDLVFNKMGSFTASVHKTG